MRLIFIGLAILFAIELHAITIFARANGDWDQVGTWSTAGVGGVSCGCIPGVGDDVIIDGYNVVIDVGTGSVTVNSLIVRSDTRNADVYLRIEDGMRLTVTTNLTLFGNRASRSQLLELIDNNTRLVIGGDLIIDQNSGVTMAIDVEASARIDVGDDVLADKDGGNDFDLRLNENNGTTATFSVTDDFLMTIDNFDTDGVRFYLNGASSLLQTGGDFSVSANTASSDAGIVLFDLNDGSMQVGGPLVLSRADDCGNIDFDMDGGNLSANSVTVNSSGTLFGATGVRFFVDQDSQVNIATNFIVNMTGGDDFWIYINENAGTTGQVNVGGNLTVTRSNGDDIEFFVDDNGSRFDINGNLTITSSGGEQTRIDLNNNAVFDVAGNFSFSHTDGQPFDMVLQAAGTPSMLIGGNLSITNAGGNDDAIVDLNGGLLQVGGNCDFTLSGSADDLDLQMDGSAQFRVGGDFTNSLNGGDDFRFGLGENTVASTALMDVAGHLRMIHNNNVGSSLMYFRIYDNTEVEAGQLTLTSNFNSAPTFSVNMTDNAVLDIDGNLNFNATSSGEVAIRVYSSARLELMGNIVRAAAPNRFGSIDCTTTGRIDLNGTSPQIISESTSTSGDYIYYYSLVLNNTSATYPQFTMEGSATINNGCTFTDGVVATTSSNLLIFADNASANSVSNASYVDGPVRKVGNDTFVFPVGDDNNYQPVAISAPAVVTDAFTAQYFETDPDALYDDALKVVAIDHISSCEYWTVDRTTGTSNVSVTLTWDANSCGVTNLSDLVVARWNGAQWVNQGNGGTTGNTSAGTVSTSAVVTAFSPFTLASITASSNPLPVELIEFTATPVHEGVKLHWRTASERNNDVFVVEYADDGVLWKEAGRVKGKGTTVLSNDYAFLHKHQIEGIVYYRLRQQDFDGTVNYSHVVAVHGSPHPAFTTYPNPATDVIYVDGVTSSITALTVADALGKQHPVSVAVSGNLVKIDVSALSAGVYYLNLQLVDSHISKKIVLSKAD